MCYAASCLPLEPSLCTYSNPALYQQPSQSSEQILEPHVDVERFRVEHSASNCSGSTRKSYILQGLQSECISSPVQHSWSHLLIRAEYDSTRLQVGFSCACIHDGESAAELLDHEYEVYNIIHQQLAAHNILLQNQQLESFSSMMMLVSRKQCWWAVCSDHLPVVEHIIRACGRKG